MLAGAIAEIAGLAFLFFVCSLLCFCLFSYLLKEEGKDDTKPPIEAWEAKHYYDPLPSAISPPEVEPTAYSFKIQNGSAPFAQPHAVINPAVLQYPPGHVLEERQILPSTLASLGFAGKGSRNSSNKVSPSRSNISTNDTKVLVGNGRTDGGGGGRGKGWISTIT